MGPGFSTAPGSVPSRIRDERGVALIIVMVMMLLLSILGATMLESSTSELKIAGNARNNEQAFYDAEQALVFGQNFASIYSALSSTVTVWPLAGGGVIYDANLNPGAANTTPGHDPSSNQIPILDAKGVPTGVTADVKVQLVGTGNVPLGSGTQMDSGISPGSGNFKANTYAVNVKSFGKNNTQVELESQTARIVQQ
jgi:Tfp pilus assembly protein PilX